MAGPVSHSLVAALRRVPLFADFDEPALLELVGASCNFCWHAGGLVFEKGEEADVLYVVLSGSVEILDVENGRENPVARVGAGAFFGEHSLLLQRVHSKRAVAREETELMILSQDRFRDLLAGRPDLERQLRRGIDERLGEAEVAEPPV